jgi:hypothetical protein
MFIRQYTWVMREIRHVLLSVWSQRHAEFDFRLSNLRALQSLFQIIPSDVVCRVDRDALNWRILRAETSEEKSIKYLQELARRMDQGIRRFPKALWEHSIEEFLLLMVKTSRPEPDTAYFPQGRLEYSLSRCFFNPESKFRVRIDSQLEKLLDLKTGQFGEAFFGFCSEFAKELTKGSRRKFVANDQLVLLLLMFRVLFNRCYEKNGEKFVATEESAGFLKKMERLGEEPASGFCLPWEFLPKVVDRSISARKLFGSDETYREAGGSLTMALFECNPLDMLERIHCGLLGVNRGADLHSGRG